MHVAFIDDSTHTGRREGMGKLISLGAAIFPQEALSAFSIGMDAIYARLGIDQEVEMKWSPPRGHALQNQGAVRAELYGKVLQLAAALEVRTVVVVWDAGRTTLQGDRAKERVLQYLYERVSVVVSKKDDVAIMVADKPGGGAKQESEWLSGTLALTADGTEHVNPERVVLPVLTADSGHLRHLQLADLVVSATTALVASPNKYAEPLVPDLMQLAARNFYGKVGGTGIKLFPDELLNLHYWVFGESEFVRVSYAAGISLPHKDLAYATDDGTSVSQV